MLPRLSALLLLLGSTGVWAETRAVPAQYATVQAAVDASIDGDVIEISPRLEPYRENVRIRGKDLTLRSVGGDVEGTVIEGVLELDDKGTPEDPSDDEMVKASVVEVRAADSVPGTDPTNVVLSGLTVRGGESGVNIRPNAHVELLDSHIVGNVDGVELEGRNETDKAFVRATVRRCLIEDNSDDGVDVDQRAQLWIEDSIIRNNFQDGIEIRLQDNQFEAGESIRNVILRNQLVDNGQDGLQLIDYLQVTPRAFRVERNVIAGNDASGLGMMCGALTNETSLGCDTITERVELVHNTFSGNGHGLTSGANVIGVSNVFEKHTNVAVRIAGGASLLEDSLFWSNGTDSVGTMLGASLVADPLLDAAFLPGAGSAALDQGAALFSVGGETILELTPCDYRGDAPDLGARERDTGPPLLTIFAMLIANASEGALEKGGKLKASIKRLDLGSSKGDVIAGLRFEEIGIPPGAVIEGAHVELVSAKKGTKPAALQLRGETGGDSAPFGAPPNGLAGRLGTSASAFWNVPLWPAAGASVQTPDLTAVVQEIVDDPAWAEGDALALFASGTGKRSVVAFDGAPEPPLLHVDFFYMVPMCPTDAL